MSQLVLTAKVRPVLATGASTGSPSNTTRLAGRLTKKIVGGSLATATGATGDWRRLRSTDSSGTWGICMVGRAARIFAAKEVARLVSSDGKWVSSNCGSERLKDFVLLS